MYSKKLKTKLKSVLINVAQLSYILTFQSTIFDIWSNFSNQSLIFFFLPGSIRIDFCKRCDNAVDCQLIGFNVKCYQAQCN